MNKAQVNFESSVNDQEETKVTNERKKKLREEKANKNITLMVIGICFLYIAGMIPYLIGKYLLPN